MSNFKYTNILTKEYLSKEYIDNNKSLYTIAKFIGCTHGTVNYYMKKYKINKRTISESGIGRKLDKYNSRYDKILTRDFLYKQYIINKKSPLDISNIVGCSSQTIIYRLKKYIINIRSYKEAVLYKKKRLGGQKGKFNPNYGNYKKNRTTPLMNSIRNIYESKEWRIAVFKRDNYTCQECFTRGISLQAHHKKPFAIILDEFLKEYNIFSPIEDKETLLRLSMIYKPFWNIDNGQTLCEDCHKTKSKSTRQFIKRNKIYE